jgi:flagellar hook-basal body complex protein FliE
MEIGRIQAAGMLPQAGEVAAPGRGGASFADMLGKALGQLQAVSTNADAKVAALATGQDVELHDVMLSLEAESLAMSLANQVRNKLVEAYQEVSRMQI